MPDWVCKNFFTLPSDTRSEAQALNRALSNAEFYQALNAHASDYVYVVYLDLKAKRFGIVFSHKALAYLKQAGLVQSDVDNSTLMNFTEMTNSFSINDIANVINKGELADMVGKNIADDTNADDIVKQAIADRIGKIESSELVHLASPIIANSIADNMDSQQIFNDAVMNVKIDLKERYSEMMSNIELMVARELLKASNE